MKESGEETAEITKCGRARRWVGTPSFYLIINFLLSQWGDWMWQFSVGVYLSELSDMNLRLAGIFGLVGGGCVLLFGGVIGDWVDRNARLKVVRVSLFLQNSAVALSAVGVCAALKSKELNHESYTYMQPLLETFVVAMAVVAQLASVAYLIAIEKDWVVVIAQGNSSSLTNLNAVIRSLDLACKIVSPMTVGYIMSAVSTFASAVVIAVWNIVSMFVEYGLLSIIYRKVPALAVKGLEGGVNSEEEFTRVEEKVKMMDGGGEEKIDEIEGKKNGKLSEINKSDGGKKKDLGGVVKRTFGVMVGGWRIYARQQVVWAGLSLALLYMTVLGFDAITVGYIIANDISAFLVGVSMGFAGVTGIIGAILFSRMAKRFGLNRTGVFSFSAEVACLTLAVASVWAPGTKFDPYLSHDNPDNTSLLNLTDYHTLSIPLSQPLTTVLPLNYTTFNIVQSQSNYTSHNNNHTKDNNDTSPPEQIFFTNNISIILLLVSIILSRIGLWMSDLVVNQLLQENIAEEERGVVNGVQNSLNMLMDMLKFGLVILLPTTNIFGVHIILSFSFVSLAMLSFFWHAARSRDGKHAKGAALGGGSDVVGAGGALHEQQMVLSVPENPIA